MLPLALMMAMSFKDAQFHRLPDHEVDRSDGMRKVLQDKQFIEAAFYSIGIALATTIAATVVGVWIALLSPAEKHLGQGC
ncbi:MAG: hypothetical protein QM711_12780 [Micropruina sp.]|uniref:hypothetical protein n=1 Tax=Micropruina sp. TaxID=2737536 RepID=UPI0039E58715